MKEKETNIIEKEMLIVNEAKIEGDTIKFKELTEIKEKNAIYKIEYNNKTGTGFFCQIPDPSNNNKYIKVLLTCYHVLNIDTNNIKITISDNNGNKKSIELKNRTIWYNKQANLDYICISLLKKDKITHCFEINQEFSIENYKKYLKGKTIYSLGYIPELDFNKGIIDHLDDDYMYCNYSTEKGWSGGPIFNKNNLVIGIHKGHSKEKNLNLGIPILSILNDMSQNGPKYNNINDELNDNDIEADFNRLLEDNDNSINGPSKENDNENDKNGKCKGRIPWLIIIILILIIVVYVFYNLSFDKKEETNGGNEETPLWEHIHRGNEYTNSLEKTITESHKYRICVYGANAEKGGKGCVQCAESYFEKGSIIKYQLGGKTSGGEGGKDCGWTGGNGHNGAGSSFASYSDYFYIEAGGGGGNSENNKKGGDCERDGEGEYGGKGATKNEYGKGGYSSNEDGESSFGGKGAESGGFFSFRKNCGGGGGDGYYGGGGGHFGSGGGGGSSYCKKRKGVTCEVSYLNKQDYSSITIDKV